MTRINRMFAGKLKFRHRRYHHDSQFFNREQMKHRGDTMRNFGVASQPRMVRDSGDTTRMVRAWYLYRIRPTPKGMTGGLYFAADDYRLLGSAQE